MAARGFLQNLLSNDFSGGTKVVVTGERLDVVTTSRLVLHLNNLSFFGDVSGKFRPFYAVLY